MADKTLVRQKLLELERTVDGLRKMAGITAEELHGSLEKAWAVQYGLQIAIQTVLDIGNHLLAAAGANDAEEYGDIITRLGERGILTEEFARAIRPMAGFRNLLVHGYARIELEKVAEILRSRLSDFESFTRQVLRYLERLPD